MSLFERGFHKYETGEVNFTSISIKPIILSQISWKLYQLPLSWDHVADSGELLVADMALEVLSLPVLNENLLVIEFFVAVIAPHLRQYSLLLPHSRCCYYCYYYFHKQLNQVVSKCPQSAVVREGRQQEGSLALL